MLHLQFGQASSFRLPNRLLPRRRVSSLVVVGSQRLAVLLEYLVVVGQGDLKLVLAFAVITSSLVTLSLLTSHALVFRNDLLVVSDLACVILVLEHANHASISRLLGSPAHFLLLVASSLVAPLTHLLISPLSLHLCVMLHSLLVHYGRKTTVMLLLEINAQPRLASLASPINKEISKPSDVIQTHPAHHQAPFQIL